MFVPNYRYQVLFSILISEKDADSEILTGREAVEKQGDSNPVM